MKTTLTDLPISGLRRSPFGIFLAEIIVSSSSGDTYCIFEDIMHKPLSMEFSMQVHLISESSVPAFEFDPSLFAVAL